MLPVRLGAPPCLTRPRGSSTPPPRAAAWRRAGPPRAAPLRALAALLAAPRLPRLHDRRRLAAAAGEPRLEALGGGRAHPHARRGHLRQLRSAAPVCRAGAFGPVSLSGPAAERHHPHGP